MLTKMKLCWSDSTSLDEGNGYNLCQATMTYANCASVTAQDGRCAYQDEERFCREVNLESRDIKYLASYTRQVDGELVNQCGGFDFLTVNGSSVGFMTPEEISS